MIQKCDLRVPLCLFATFMILPGCKLVQGKGSQAANVQALPGESSFGNCGLNAARVMMCAALHNFPMSKLGNLSLSIGNVRPDTKPVLDASAVTFRGIANAVYGSSFDWNNTTLVPYQVNLDYGFAAENETYTVVVAETVGQVSNCFPIASEEMFSGSAWVPVDSVCAQYNH